MAVSMQDRTSRQRPKLFSLVTESESERALRAEVRQFLADTLPLDYRPRIAMAHDPAFTKLMAHRGWVGMAIPTEYGGQGASAVDRFVVIEELLAVGAPVAAHWMADRQTAPMLLAFGTESQKRRFLPAIASGDCFFSLGMSEADAGSDLAAVRTSATRTARGWKLNGAKVWTTDAHHNHYAVVLCRTSPLAGRNSGLSQLIVDLRGDGVSISPIPLLDHSRDFNEVVFNDVFVPEDMVLGDLDAGWQQVTSELALERSGPERYMSSFPLFLNYIRERVGANPEPAVAEALGHLVARFRTIRLLSLSVARELDGGAAPALAAAMVKDIGTVFEQEVIERIRSLIDEELDPTVGSRLELMLAEALLVGASFTLRGGTTEVLRLVTAKQLIR